MKSAPPDCSQPDPESPPALPAGRRALLLSAYDASSHRHWRQMLCAMFPEIHWTQLTLPPRYFSWRLRGNSLSWAFNHRATLTDNHDFLIATSMVDLSALRGLVPELARLPTAVYFHENQFAYPATEKQFASVEPQILNLYTALCADQLIFNSQYNRQSFLDGVEQLLGRLPDHVPSGLHEKLSHSSVIPVPLGDELFALSRPGRERRHPVSATEKDSVMNVIWNHRWEYDKGPELLLLIVRELMTRPVRFRLHVVGEQFRSMPAQFTELQTILEEYYRQEQITPGEFGFIENRQTYLGLLSLSDVVLSTACHDFQGLALLEGIASGCTPLAPDRLVYPEYLDGKLFLYRGDSAGQEAAAAANRLQHWSQLLQQGEPLPVTDAGAFSATRLRRRYQELLLRLCASAPEKPCTTA